MRALTQLRSYSNGRSRDNMYARPLLTCFAFPKRTPTLPSPPLQISRHPRRFHVGSWFQRRHQVAVARAVVRLRCSVLRRVALFYAAGAYCAFAGSRPNTRITSRSSVYLIVLTIVLARVWTRAAPQTLQIPAAMIMATCLD